MHTARKFFTARATSVQSLALRSLPPRYALTNIFSPLTSLLAARATLASATPRQPLDRANLTAASLAAGLHISSTSHARASRSPPSAGRAGTLPYGLETARACGVRAADRTVRPTCVVSRLITHGGSARHVESARRRSSAFGPRKVESGAQSVYGVQGLRCTVL